MILEIVLKQVTKILSYHSLHQKGVKVLTECLKKFKIK